MKGKYQEKNAYRKVHTIDSRINIDSILDTDNRLAARPAHDWLFRPPYLRAHNLARYIVAG